MFNGITYGHNCHCLVMIKIFFISFSLISWVNTRSNRNTTLTDFEVLHSVTIKTRTIISVSCKEIICKEKMNMKQKVFLSII